MTKEDLKKIAMRYAHDELKDNHAPVEVIVAAAFLNGIDYAEHHPYWISVEDELPPDTGLYLVVQYNAVQAYWWFDEFEEWDEIFKWKGGLHSNRMEGVSHWMPLPSPPRGSSGKPNNCKKGGEK